MVGQAAIIQAVLANQPPPLIAHPLNQDPIMAKTALLNARLTGYGRQLKGNANSEVFSFNRKKAVQAGGQAYYAAGLTDLNSNPIISYLSNSVLNGLRQIRPNYHPTSGNAYSLFTMAHELGHAANKNHGSEYLADRYANSAFARLAGMFGITNQKKVQQMLALAHSVDPQYAAYLRHRG